MNKRELNSGLRFIMKRLEKAEKFALDQMPDICKQIVLKRRIEMAGQLIFTGVGFLLAFSVFLFCAHRWYAYVPRSDYDNPTDWIMGSVISSLVSLGFGAGVGDAISELIYLKMCTKLFLLKAFRRLIK